MSDWLDRQDEMETQPSETTFIVRFWPEGDVSDSPKWRGAIERIGSERHGTYQTLDELLEWLSLELDLTRRNGK